MVVKFDLGKIPLCPKCKKGTKRTGGISSSTAMYFAPVYDENGVNINPDRNIITFHYNCLDCGEDYKIIGNHIDGFEYKSNG